MSNKIPEQNANSSCPCKPKDPGKEATKDTLNRRQLLVLTGEAAAVGTLAACGGTDDMMNNSDLGCGTTVATGAESLQVGQVKSFLNTSQAYFSYFIVRDDKGFYCLRNVCAHSGCQTSFNSGAKTFDCPCHGSRYNFDGSLKNGPATSGLTSFTLCRRGDGMLTVDASGTGSTDLTQRVK